VLSFTYPDGAPEATFTIAGVSFTFGFATTGRKHD
jgi:hypothetical protein